MVQRRSAFRSASGFWVSASRRAPPHFNAPAQAERPAGQVGLRHRRKALSRVGFAVGTAGAAGYRRPALEERGRVLVPGGFRFEARSGAPGEASRLRTLARGAPGADGRSLPGAGGSHRVALGGPRVCDRPVLRLPRRPRTQVPRF